MRFLVGIDIIGKRKIPRIRVAYEWPGGVVQFAKDMDKFRKRSTRTLIKDDHLEVFIEGNRLVNLNKPDSFEPGFVDSLVDSERFWLTLSVLAEPFEVAVTKPKAIVCASAEFIVPFPQGLIGTYDSICRCMICREIRSERGFSAWLGDVVDVFWSWLKEGFRRVFKNE